MRFLVHSSSGDVRVLLPVDGEGYAAEATTGSGDRTVNIQKGPAASRRLRVTTSSGDVSVTYRDES